MTKLDLWYALHMLHLWLLSTTFSSFCYTAWLIVSFIGIESINSQQVSINMAPSGPAYHTDWLWCPSANVHIANNRKWFTTFKKIKSQVVNPHCHCSGGEFSTTEIDGIGDVELNVVTRENRTGPKSPTKLVLRNVLYAPNTKCNVLGNPILERYYREPSTSSKRSWLRDNDTGAVAIVLDHPVLPRLRLVGMNPTETVLKDKLCSRRMTWSDEERAKWLAPKTPSLPELTPEQKAWIKEHYKTEWKFLMLHGLKMHVLEQRLEGRVLLTVLMREDSKDKQAKDKQLKATQTKGTRFRDNRSKNSQAKVKHFKVTQRQNKRLKDKEEVHSDSDMDDYFRDMEEDPTSHIADGYFVGKLGLIKKHYGHTGNFMRSLGLKPWDNQDCEEAVQIARSMRA